MEEKNAALYRSLAQLAARYGAEKLVLFGSRARNDCTDVSDIDLAIYGMPEENRSRFWWEAEALPTLLKLDIVHMADSPDPAFGETVAREGVTLYEKN